MTKPVTFWLSEQDQDLIDWLDSLPKGQRSQSIRSTLRAGIEGQKQDRIYAKLDEIIGRLGEIQIVRAGTSCPDGYIDIDVGLSDTLLATLGGLGE